MRMVSARELVGRKIVGFKANKFQAYDKRWAHDPVILLDDGTSLYFIVEETGSEPGVFIGKTKKGKK